MNKQAKKSILFELVQFSLRNEMGEKLVNYWWKKIVGNIKFFNNLN